MSDELKIYAITVLIVCIAIVALVLIHADLIDGISVARIN